MSTEVKLQELHIIQFSENPKALTFMESVRGMSAECPRTSPKDVRGCPPIEEDKEEDILLRGDESTD